MNTIYEQMDIRDQIISAFGGLILVIDERGRFVDSINSANVEMLAHSSEFMGRHFSEILPPALSDLLAAKMQQHSGDNNFSFEYELRMPSGMRWFSCSFQKLKPNKERPQGGHLALINDITEIVEQRNNVQRKEQLLIASATANEALLVNRDIVQAISLGVRELGTAMKVDRCYLFETAWSEDVQERVLNQRFEWSADSASPQIDNPELQNLPFSTAGLFLDPMFERKPFICIVRKLPDTEVKAILEMQNIRSLVALPIYVNDHLWGFVGFDDCQKERNWSGADISTLQSFATSIANAVIRKETEDNLVSAKNEAEHANNAKSEFLFNITHEIRTPLHGVVGNAELLSHYAFSAPDDEYFHNLRLSANTLFELINNILDFGRIEAGAFDFNPENFLLEDIIKSARASVSYLLSISSNVLETEIDTTLPTIIYMDPTRLKQVLVNLISNALKFSNNTKVQLEVRQENNGIRFVVRDHGIGMSKEQMEKLFRPFTQFDSSFSKKYQGSGLGLSITNHILRKLDSVPEVDSTPGVGTTVSFLLPMENISARSSDVASNKPDETPIRDLDKTVLIVEDNRINMLLAERMIRDAYPSISIHKAFDGVEALRTLEGGLNPDIILMDLQMPLMDGFETTRRIRATKGSDIRIIALTASAVSQIRDQCLEVGMNDFLSKPFTREQLAAVLQPAPGSQDRTPVEMTVGAPAH